MIFLSGLCNCINLFSYQKKTGNRINLFSAQKILKSRNNYSWWQRNRKKSVKFLMQWEMERNRLFNKEIASASESYNKMEQLLYIGAACVEQNPEKRLTMRDAVKKIEEIQIGEGRAPTLKEEYAKLAASPIRP